MKSGKSLDILKRIILTIILFAVYILIINMSDRIFQTEVWSEEIEKNINFFCIYVSVIFTVIYNLIAKRFLNLDYEKAGDYILSFVVFALANIIYCYIVPMPNEEYGWVNCCCFIGFISLVVLYTFCDCTYTIFY